MSHRKRCSLHLEALEARNLLTGLAFHNFDLPEDVNGDEMVSPIDALVVIDRLNSPPPSETEVPPVDFADVNGDGYVSPGDALRVVHYLNYSQPQPGAPDPSTASLRLTSQLSSSRDAESAMVVYDRDLEDGVVQQALQVQVKNAQPETTLQINIAGQPVGTINTDLEGNAELTLSTDPGEGEQLLPVGFPTMEPQMAVSVGSTLSGILDELNGVTSVDVLGCDLVIGGDDDNNFIVLTQVGYQEYLVVGVNTALDNRDGGEVFMEEWDGVELYFTFATGVRDDVRVHMRGGDDVFLMGGYIDPFEAAGESLVNGTHSQLEVPGRLDIFTENGDDLVFVGGTRVGAGALINVGQGEQNVVAVGGGAAAVGAMDLDMLCDIFDILPPDFGGEMGDEVLLEIIRSALGETTVADSLIIDTFDGDDAVYVGDAHIGDQLVINTRCGDDTVFVGTGGLRVTNTVGLDNGLANVSEALDLKADVEVGGYLHIHTHNGDDLVRLGGAIECYELDGESVNGSPLVVPGGLEVGKGAYVYTHRGYDEVLVGVNAFGFDLFEPAGAEGENGWIYDLGYDVRIGLDLHIHSGSDGDLVQIGGGGAGIGLPDVRLQQDGVRKVLEVGRSLFIITDGGADEVLLQSPQRGTVMVPLSLEIEPGSPDGHDINVGGRVHIDTGSDDDNVTISGAELIGSGDRTIGILRAGADLFIATGCGRDQVVLDGETDYLGGMESEFFGIAVEDDLFVITGSGEDDIRIRAVSVGDYAHLNSGIDNDRMIIDYLFAHYLEAFLGGHDDCFDIANSPTARRSLAFGGWGFDKYAVTNTDIALISFEEEVKGCCGGFLE